MNFLHLTSSAADTAGGRIKQAHIARGFHQSQLAQEVSRFGLTLAYAHSVEFIESLAT